MKFNTKELVETLTIMNKMDRGTFSHSEFVFLRSRDGITKLFRMNGHTEIVTEFQTDNIDCDVAVERKGLLNAVKEVGKKNSTITLEVNKDNMTMKVGNFVLKLIDSSDIVYHVHSDIQMWQFPVEELSNAFNHTIHAAGCESVMNPSVIHIVDGKRLYASDNFRLAIYDMKESLGTTEKLCIHSSSAKFIADAVGITKAKTGDIGVTNDMLVVRIGRHTIGVWLRDYILPEYDLILAKEHKTVVYVNAHDMINALKQIKKISKADYVHIEMDPNNSARELTSDIYFTDSIRLFSRDTDGTITASIDVPVTFDDRENERVEKIFNIQYLLDALKPVEKEIISLSDPGADNGWIDIYGYRYRVMIMGAELL